MNAAVVFALQYPSVPGVLALTVFVLIRMALVSQDRKRCEWFLAATVLAIPAAGACQLITIGLSRLRPYKLDQYIFRISEIFGEPSFVLGRIVNAHVWSLITISIVYGCLDLAMLAVLAAYIWLRDEDEALEVVRTFLLNLSLAVPIYMLIPVCGPAYAFAGFPYVMPQIVAPHGMAINAPPNGIPSVHTSTALLIVWFARRWRGGYIVALIYLALMLVSTLATGQHYIVDLIAAVPYTALVIRLGKIEWMTRRGTTAMLAAE